MTAIDEAELQSFDWAGAIGRTFTKYFEVASIRYGVTLETLVGRSWHVSSCACETCTAFDLRLAPLHAMIAKSLERNAAGIPTPAS